MNRWCLQIAIATIMVCCCCSAAFAAITIPHVARGSINLNPYYCYAAHSVAFWKNHVYVAGAATSGAGPTIWNVDVSNPNNLVFVNGAGSGYKAYGIKPVADVLYAANWSSLFRTYDISDGSVSQMADFYVNGTAGWNLDVYKDRAYVAQGTETQSSLYIMDITNPGSPSIVNTYPMNRAGGLTARGSYVYIVDDHIFRILNVSDDDNPYLMSAIDLGALLTGVRVRGNYAYIYWNGIVDGGFYIYDISDPTNPVQIGSFYGALANDFYLMGNYAFYSTGGNGYMTLDISNPANPIAIAQSEIPFYCLELCLTGNGRYLYVGGLDGNSQGWLTAFEVFDKDPDNVGPSDWGSFYPTQTSYDVQYEADFMPVSSNPAWTLVEGSDSWASVSDGVLRINDTGTVSGDKVKWIRNWNGTNSRGTTVFVRSRCASYSPSGTEIPNIVIEDGKYTEEFSLLSDKIRANNSNLQYNLDGTQWHTYRITTSGTTFRVYVDEASTPVITGTLSTTTQRSRITFGSGSSGATQDIYIDYLYCFADGSRGPAAVTSDITPDVSVNVADSGNGSTSGIDPASVLVHWSTDGGNTWKSSGWDCLYNANAKPCATSPVWTLAEGSESYASTSSGVLRVNDNSTAGGSKVKWSRDWCAVPCVGTTVVARAYVASAGGDTSFTGNIFVEDGVKSEYFKILTDRIVAVGANQTYMLDATQWHTYRVTTKGTTFNLYVDENPTPVLTDTMTTEASANRVMFGSGASAGTQDIYFDYTYYTVTGAYAPGQGCDGTYVSVSCNSVPGDDRGTVSATAIPFNQNSDTLNKVKFSLRDKAGNTGFSPAYNVRVNGPVNNAQYISDTIPTTMNAGQQYSVSVTMKNTGGTTWTANGLYKLGGVDDTDPFANTRQDLSGGDSIAPNAQKTFTFTMTAPTTPGTYTTDWRMVQDNVGWYGDTLTKQVQVVGAPTDFNISAFNSNPDGWNISVWKSGPYTEATMAWNSGAGRSGGGIRTIGSGGTDNTDRCNREGGEIRKTISTSGYHDIKISYDLRVNSMGNNNTGGGIGTCAVDHNLVDEQLTVYYSTDGGSNWTEANYLTRSNLLGYTSYGTRTVDLSSITACNNNANFAVRFRWQVNSTSDTVDLDNIKITGTP